MATSCCRRRLGAIGPLHNPFCVRSGRMAVHQLVPSLTLGDATSLSVIHFRMLLRRLGIFGNIYVDQFSPKLGSLAQPASGLRPAPGDLVLYHHGIASPLAGRLLHLPCKKGVVYHNVTPARFYRGHPLALTLEQARSELSAMAAHVDVALGDSELNCAELRRSGYSNVHEVNLFVEPERFSLDSADAKMLAQLRGPGPSLLFVGRVVPNKRIEDLLLLHEELLRLSPSSRLLVVGGYEPGGSYFRRLKKRSAGQSGIHFLGRLSHAQLVAAYRASSMFVSMSEHEGFNVPLLEAMASEIPVLAYASCAVPGTLGGAGIAFTEKRFAFLAELVREVDGSDSLKKALLRGQQERLSALSAGAAELKLKKALSSVGLRRARAPRRRAHSRPRVAFVIHRYGEVSGGSERLCRMVCHRMAKHWDVTVLTTCADDHLTWKNSLPPGESADGPVRVLRFGVDRSRRMGAFNALSRKVFAAPADRLTEEHWIAEQGPVSAALLDHLAKSASAYDGFVHFTYLYATAVWGLPLVASRSMLVPTAHDEPAIRLKLFSEIFSCPRALLCSTPEEKELIQRLFPQHARIVIAGTGVQSIPADARRFRGKFGVEGPYLFYVGRLEAGKGIPELISFHRDMKQRDAGAPSLVLAGHSSLGPSDSGAARLLGTISEQDKADALSGASAVVIPSRYESLSLLALEAFSQGAPVLANAESPVLAGQMARSQGGLTYRDAGSFAEGVRELLREREGYSKRGLAFAKRHSWSRVESTYRTQLKRIMENPA